MVEYTYGRTGRDRACANVCHKGPLLLHWGRKRLRKGISRRISRNPEFRQIVCKEERCRAGGLQRRYFPDIAFSRITRYNTHQDEDDKEATAKEWTQKQFNDYMNNPAFYQIEDPHWNRSHRFAMK